MPFKRGTSGNPSGRPPKTAEILEVESLARQHTKAAITRLVDWLQSDNAKASVSAAVALLDRGYGKARQMVDAHVTHRVVTGSSEQLSPRLEQALRKRSQPTVQ